MSAPRKVRKNQLVRIRPMQSLTNSIEATIALQEVTNVMKPIEATYQAATQVKVLSSEMFNKIEADVFHCAEGSMKGDAMVSHHSLYRGQSPWHDMRWSLRKLGRSSVFSKEYVRTEKIVDRNLLWLVRKILKAGVSFENTEDIPSLRKFHLIPY